MTLETILLILLLIKHYIADFPLQSSPYMYQNKGTWMHPGGLLHAGIHALLTTFILLFLTFWHTGTPWPLLAFMVGFGIDGWLHYHIDYIKVNITRDCG
jgi:hypothetical protein